MTDLPPPPPEPADLGPEPPQDLRAEQSVLGACLLDGAGADMAVDVLRAQLAIQDFYRPAHATIAAAILDLASAGISPDPVTVAGHLQALGKLPTVGGHGYLHTVVEMTPTAANAAHYAKIVAEKAALRVLIRSGTQLVHAGYAGGLEGDVAEAYTRAISELTGARDSLSRGGPPSDLTDFADVADEEQLDSDWVVPYLLAHQDRVIVVADEGVGKTMLARQVAVCVAQGRHPFWPSVRIRAGRALMVDLENPRGVVSRKTKLFVDAHRREAAWERNRALLWHRPGGIDLRRAADAADLERRVEHCQPDVLIISPVYKAMRARSTDSSDDAAAEISAVLDRLRERYGCALWLEHHAPMAQGGARRDMRPVGTGWWMRWPEFRIALRRPQQDPSGRRLEIGRFAGDREEREWPQELHRGGTGEWPWMGFYEDGAPLWMRSSQGALSDG